MSVADLVSVPFQWGSAIRRQRVFHPDGVLADGAIERVAPPGEGLPVPSADIVARVSKAAGTPGPLPDAIGLALRVAPQQEWPTSWDILLASAGSGPITRVVGLRPATSWTGTSLTTLVPLCYRHTNWWLRARITTHIGGFGLSLDGIRGQLDNGTISVELDQARARSPFRPVARVTLTRPRPAGDVSFDPVMHCAPGVHMYPRWLTELRARAYGRSREGRDAG